MLIKGSDLASPSINMLLKHQIVVFHSNSDLIVQTWSVIGNPPRNRWFKFQMERSGYDGWHTVHLVTCFTPLWAVRQCTSNVRQCCRKSCKISKCKHSILAGEGYATHACQFNISYGPQPVILSTNRLNGKHFFNGTKVYIHWMIEVTFHFPLCYVIP